MLAQLLVQFQKGGAYLRAVCVIGPTLSVGVVHFSCRLWPTLGAEVSRSNLGDAGVPSARCLPT